MNKLTVIIPFLNEGEEVKNTVDSMLQHSKNNVDILLINDASEDDYDYAQIANTPDITYIENEKRLGVARSRDLGVERCNTPYFLLLDAHMRFYDSEWVDAIVSALEKNDRILLSCRTKVLWKENGIVTESTAAPATYGAHINFHQEGDGLSTEWSMKCLKSEDETAEIINIPCILGAAYAASKRYWQYLKGLSGLLYYGSDEPYISMKVWLEGGECKLLKNIVVGHIYRKEFPYQVENKFTLYNKLLIAAVLLPPDLKNNVFSKLKQTYVDVFEEAYGLLLKKKNNVTELKSYYQQIRTKDFSLIVNLNAKN